MMIRSAWSAPSHAPTGSVARAPFILSADEFPALGRPDAGSKRGAGADEGDSGSTEAQLAGMPAAQEGPARGRYGDGLAAPEKRASSAFQQKRLSEEEKMALEERRRKVREGRVGRKMTGEREVDAGHCCEVPPAGTTDSTKASQDVGNVSERETADETREGGAAQSALGDDACGASPQIPEEGGGGSAAGESKPERASGVHIFQQPKLTAADRERMEERKARLAERARRRASGDGGVAVRVN
ncbi:hypothetical protein B0H15DRAFT_943930 [Mycena belliarum]|uniref:Uncharacterized protein n=1 Tax=Mycena belliarum TaxID=1033014 RepID=A0AAD6UIZ7_9AGAR|nr:hypothetical protein B0H15DRAFT_943930 [Mycena belliae]